MSGDASPSILPRAPGNPGLRGREPARRAILLLLAFALLLVAVQLYPFVRYRHVRAGQLPSWVGHQDPDTPLLHSGLVEAPRPEDTLRWWHGPWVGKLPYYRPLTSYGFWFEWKAFGDREWLFGYPTALAHLVAALLFALFAFRLAERRHAPWPLAAGAVAAWGFVFGFPGLFFHERVRVNHEIVEHWKNQPDSWTAICCFAALLAYLRAQAGSRQALPAAAGWFAVGCGFKELSLPLVAAFGALEVENLLRGDRRAALRRLMVIAGVAAFFIALRLVFIRQVWYSYAANRAWLPRTLSEFLGPFAASAIAGEWIGNALGLWLFAVLLAGLRWGARHSPGRRLLAAAAGALGGALLIGDVALVSSHQFGWGEFLSPVRLVQAGLYCFQPDMLTGGVGTLLFLLAVRCLWVRDRWVLFLAVTWTAAFLLLYTFSPGNIYRYYMSQCGYMLLLGLAAGYGLPVLFAAVPHRVRPLTVPAPAPAPGAS